MSHHDPRRPVGTGDWLLWPHFALRGAGFPFADLEAALRPAAGGLDAGEWWAHQREAIARCVELAARDEIRMALLWQNPAVLTNVVEELTRDADRPYRRTRARRRRERTLARYLQRYYARNDSIGFFGPVVWGGYSDQPCPIDLRTGPGLTSSALIRFEDWAIDALGQVLASADAVRWCLPPALRIGTARLGATLMREGRARRLSTAEHQVVVAVDGERRPDQIVEVTGQPPAEVRAVLTRLADEGFVIWGFDVPVDVHPERALERELRALPAIPEVVAGRRALATLRRRRDAVSSAKTPNELAAAMRDLDEAFQSSTGVAAARPRTDSAYGRRLLVAQHQRAVELRLGRAVWDELAAPLALVLDSARWFCWRAGALFETSARRVHDELSPLFPGDRVPLGALCDRLLPVIARPRWADDLVADLTARWSAILRPERADPRLARGSDELAVAVAGAFAAPAPGWYAGRHHSPDIMIAAEDATAIRRGRYAFVLGELHVGVVTSDSCNFNEFPPGAQAILAAAEAAVDDALPRFVPLHSRTAPEVTGFNYPMPETFSPRYRYLSFGRRSGERAVPAGCRIPAAEVAVERDGAGLAAVFTGGQRHPLLQVLGEYVSYAVSSRFRILPPMPHTPRLTVDRLVVTRETWQIPLADIAALAALPEPAAFAGLRELAAAHGLARRVFWRLPGQGKPILLDLGSTVLVDLFLDGVRRRAGEGGAVTFTEMLPDSRDLWLVDEHGRRYTSELRLTLADSSG